MTAVGDLAQTGTPAGATDWGQTLRRTSATPGGWSS
jgi:hypothetical protein